LVLTRRVEPVQSEVSAGSQAIFGGAKPVDTAAREREIEERLAKREEGLDARYSNHVY
jgi:translation initiation factor 4B